MTPEELNKLRGPEDVMSDEIHDAIWEALHDYFDDFNSMRIGRLMALPEARAFINAIVNAECIGDD